MTTSKPQPDLAEAANQFLLKVDVERANCASLTMNSFVQWCGAHRAPSTLSPIEISRFSQQFSPTDPELKQKIDTLREFLVYIKECQWSGNNLAIHAKPRKRRASKTSAGNGRPAQKPIVLTSKGHSDLTAELEALKSRKPGIIKAIQLAAADKDFRENAPLAAAKEELGHVEGRINELEDTLKLAKITSAVQNNQSLIQIGDQVSLKETETGAISCYTIVTSKESNPLVGKISDSSPIGKALLGKSQGDIVEISAPAGTLSYTIEDIGHSKS